MRELSMHEMDHVGGGLSVGVGVSVGGLNGLLGSVGKLAGGLVGGATSALGGILGGVTGAVGGLLKGLGL